MEKPTLLNVNLLNVKTSIRFKASVSFINVWQKYSSLKKFQMENCQTKFNRATKWNYDFSMIDKWNISLIAHNFKLTVNFLCLIVLFVLHKYNKGRFNKGFISS